MFFPVQVYIFIFNTKPNKYSLQIKIYKKHTQKAKLSYIIKDIQQTHFFLPI